MKIIILNWLCNIIISNDEKFVVNELRGKLEDHFKNKKVTKNVKYNDLDISFQILNIFIIKLKNYLII